MRFKKSREILIYLYIIKDLILCKNAYFIYSSKILENDYRDENFCT